MHGIWISTEVYIDEVEGYLWGEGKKIWSNMSDDEQWECFDWMCDTLTTVNDTGDIDIAIVDWYKEKHEGGDDDDDDEISDEGRCRRESRRMRFRRKR